MGAKKVCDPLTKTLTCDGQEDREITADPVTCEFETCPAKKVCDPLTKTLTCDGQEDREITADPVTCEFGTCPAKKVCDPLTKTLKCDGEDDVILTADPVTCKIPDTQCAEVNPSPWYVPEGVTQWCAVVLVVPAVLYSGY